MKEDYLWDKTGGDFDIEQLENTLQAFRYQETAPPGLPAKIIPFEAKPSRRLFKLTFAFALFAAIAVVCFSAWFYFPNVKTEIAKDSPKIISPPNVENTVKEIPLEKTTNLMIENTETPKNSIKKEVVKIKKFVPQVVRPNKPEAREAAIKNAEDLIANKQAEKPPVKLTKEETYAYNQLMLALSITSSKLKIVTDKLEGIEEQNAVRVNER